MRKTSNGKIIRPEEWAFDHVQRVAAEERRKAGDVFRQVVRLGIEALEARRDQHMR